MKVKLMDIVQTNTVLNTILNSKMKAGTAFKFRKIMKFVEENLQLFNETKQSIIDKYELKDNDEGKLDIPVDSVKEVQSEFDDLLYQEIDFDLFVHMNDLADVNITPNELDIIMWMVKGAE